MHFTRLMGMISLGIGLMLFALFLQSPVNIFATFSGFVTYCFPPIFVGIDLLFRKSSAPADQVAVLQEELGKVESEVWIDFETSPGDSRC